MCVFHLSSESFIFTKKLIKNDAQISASVLHVFDRRGGAVRRACAVGLFIQQTCQVLCFSTHKLHTSTCGLCCVLSVKKMVSVCSMLIKSLWHWTLVTLRLLLTPLGSLSWSRGLASLWVEFGPPDGTSTLTSISSPAGSLSFNFRSSISAESNRVSA